MSLKEKLCVEPLSSPYGFFPRAHTYALVLVLFALPPRGWIFRAALATFTTRTAVFAVDACVALAALRRRDSAMAAPLDVLVATEALALAGIVALWLLHRFNRMAESAELGLVRLWAVIVGVGAFVGFAALKKLGGLHAASLNCRDAWRDRVDIVGEDQTFGGGIGVVGDKIGWFILRVGIPGLVFASVALLSALVPRPAPAAKSAQVEAGLDLAGLDGFWTQENPSSFYPKLRAVIGRALPIALPSLAIYVVISAEYWILTFDLPAIEKTTSFGQWAVWAATGVVLLATVANKILENISDDGM